MAAEFEEGLEPRRYRSSGKQVLKDGAHFADAVDVEAAEYIARAMNEGGGLICPAKAVMD